MAFEFATLTQLGKEYGVGAKKIGDWLIKIGLRTSDREPSTLARSEGFVKHVRFEDGNSFDVWHRSKTIAVLEGAGFFKPSGADEIETSPSPDTSGPHDITDPKGEVVAQANDLTIASFLTRVIKLAADNGRWPPKVDA